MMINLPLDGRETQSSSLAPHWTGNICWKYGHPKRSESLPPNHWIVFGSSLGKMGSSTSSPPHLDGPILPMGSHGSSTGAGQSLKPRVFLIGKTMSLWIQTLSEKALNPPNASKLYPKLKNFLRRYLDSWGLLMDWFLISTFDDWRVPKQYITIQFRQDLFIPLVVFDLLGAPFWRSNNIRRNRRWWTWAFLTCAEYIYMYIYTYRYCRYGIIRSSFWFAWLLFLACLVLLSFLSPRHSYPMLSHWSLAKNTQTPSNYPVTI